jgi:plasmid maintenance system antidote protein VapI
MLAELLTGAGSAKPAARRNALRRVLEEHGLSQRGAAMELGIDERTMRRYIAGDLDLPRVVALALAWLVQTKGKPSQ